MTVSVITHVAVQRGDNETHPFFTLCVVLYRFKNK